uniref:Kaptin n=3 Tax=Schistocephalus solidus TaxID=70667 RepID=A0A0V0J921_SCHSO
MVTYMDFVMLKTDPPVRLSAFGCIDGWFGVGMTDISKPVLLHFFSGSHDSPITCVKLFKQFPEPSPHPLGSQGETVEPPFSAGTPEEFSLLVCSGFEPAVVYQNVYTCQHFGSDNQAVLHGSADFDHVNCACVGDLDFDGRPEIVIGTFGQQLLLYRWVTDEERTSDSVVAVAAAADKASLPGRYECVSRRTVAGQVHSLLYGYDFLGDGCLCLAVLTSQGLQVLQCKSETVMDLLERRLDCLLADSKL